ncbi:MAG: MATE family efflux transporter [Phycisphaerales bacterium]|nr:MATE family efflux transporter [Phycisphaerales bacterium]
MGVDLTEVHEPTSVDRSADSPSAPTPGPKVTGEDSGALREMLTIAIPSVATMTSYTIMAFVDKFMVKDIGEDPVYIAAQSNGSMFVWMFMAYVLGMNGVINSFVSQNLGAKKAERGAAYAWNGLWVGLLYFVVLMVPMYWMIPGLFSQSWMFGDDPQLAGLSTEYAQVVLLGGVFVIGARTLHHYFYGMHRASVVLISAVLGNITNLLVNLLLIFGDAGMPVPEGWLGSYVIGPISEPIALLASSLGIEAMGITGAAIGTLMGSAVEFVVPFLLFISPKYARLFGTRKAWRASAKCLKDLFKVGAAPGFMFANEMVCWTILLVWLIPRGGEAVGDDPVLHNTVGWIALQYMHLSFMPAVGISIAAQAMVGKAMGRGRPDIALARTMLALKITLGYMGLCALCFVVFREPLIAVFINEGTSVEERARLIEIGVKIMIAAAVFQVFDAVAITLTGALRGAGDTVWPGVVTIILSWVCIPGVGWLLIVVMPEWGSIGPWIGASLYIIGLGIALGFRFWGGKWKTMTLVDPDAEPDLDPFDDILPDPTLTSG